MKRIKIGPVSIVFGEVQTPDVRIDIAPPDHVNCKNYTEEQEDEVTMFFCSICGNRLKKVLNIVGYNPLSGEEIEETEWHCTKCNKKLLFNAWAFGIQDRFTMVNIKNSKKKGK